ncbi:MAG TPA: dTDP-4-dehydrorhamnose 3,5-epimerase [Pyrinomonadaceae bacterium]|nr:dTDP-4-dehydrorhamnose 3,5-epimerase [Pyrinomonadaceae bacterium]
MQITPLRLAGSFLVETERIRDERGFFMRLYDAEIFAAHDLQTIWMHDSQSFNRKRHTVRGLHFQLPPFEETKLVRVTSGAISDVIVDLRKESATYGEWEVVELSEENGRALYIPVGFAHGFCTLTDAATVNYKIDAPYDAASTSGIRWNDATLNINWQTDAPVISERDRQLQLFSDFVSPF